MSITFSAIPAADGATTEIRLADEKVSVIWNAGPDDVAETIAILGQARAQMADQVPVTLEPGIVMRSVVHDAAYQEFEPFDTKVHLGLRHPGFGWAVYTFEPARAREMAEKLVRLAEAAEARR